jgi:hypothetical protein
LRGTTDNNQVVFAFVFVFVVVFTEHDSDDV